MLPRLNRIKVLVALAAFSLAVSTSAAFAQDTQVRKLANGQKYKIRGVIVAKSDEGFLLRDETGVDTKVVLTSVTSIKSNGFFGGDRYATSSLVRGLRLKAEGRGDGDKQGDRQPDAMPRHVGGS